MNPQVDAYIAEAPDGQRPILEALRELLLGMLPEAGEQFKWSRPVYRVGPDFAYLKSSKNYVTLGFNKAGLLNDPDGRLEGTGKDMRHLKLRTMADVDHKLLAGWFKAAAGGER